MDLVNPSKRISPGDLVWPRDDVPVILWSDYEIRTYEGKIVSILTGPNQTEIKNFTLVIAIFDPISRDEWIVALYDSTSKRVGYVREMFLRSLE